MAKHTGNLPPIVYEDEWLIAFNKPSGLAATAEQAGPGRASLLELARAHLSREIHNTFLLDSEASGLVLCAKTKPALDAVTGQFQQHSETRSYLALVLHAPPQEEMEVSQPVEPDPDHPGRMRIGGGKRALARTRIRTMARWRGYSLLSVIPETSHAHQIRVHLAYLGCPALADPLYGSAGGLKLSALKPRYRFKAEPERPLLARLALHAAQLSFKHPATQAAITIEAPLAKDFKIALNYLKRFAGTGFSPAMK